VSKVEPLMTLSEVETDAENSAPIP